MFVPIIYCKSYQITSVDTYDSCISPRQLTNGPAKRIAFFVYFAGIDSKKLTQTVKYPHFQYEIHLHSGSVHFPARFSYIRVSHVPFFLADAKNPPATFHSGSLGTGGDPPAPNWGSRAQVNKRKASQSTNFSGAPNSSPLTALRKDDFIHPTFTKNGTVVDSEIRLFFHHLGRRAKKP